MTTITDILHQVDSGHLALPDFQRPYVWSRDQVLQLFNALYLRRPIGTILVWTTDAAIATRGEMPSRGWRTLILDGQQRIASIYSVVKGVPPPFFGGKESPGAGLQFHPIKEVFEFNPPDDDPLWSNVSEFFARDYDCLDDARMILDARNEGTKFHDYLRGLQRLLGILNIYLHLEELDDPSLSSGQVIEILDALNSAGTQYSEGDLQRRRSQT